MAKDLEAKFVFIMGAAAKAKKLPHMTTIRKQKGADSKQDQPDTTGTAQPEPVEMLDIL